MAIALVGCGRLGFDGSSDAGPDAVTPLGLRDLCGSDRITVVRDDVPIDDEVGEAVRLRLAERCAVPTTTVSQDDPGVLADDGRLLLGTAELAILAGGDGPHRAVAYLLIADTPVIWSGSSTATYVERATGRTLLSGPVSETHDYPLVMVVEEPISGTRALSVSGMTANGTVAAGWWFTERVLADPRGAWVLVEWTDDDATTGPSDGDVWSVVAQE